MLTRAPEGRARLGGEAGGGVGSAAASYEDLDAVLAAGEQKGLREGRAEEGARALLTVLRVRGVAVPLADRERIMAEREPERLERWLEKAIVADSLAEVPS